MCPPTLSTVLLCVGSYHTYKTQEISVPNSNSLSLFSIFSLSLSWYFWTEAYLKPTAGGQRHHGERREKKEEMEFVLGRGVLEHVERESGMRQMGKGCASRKLVTDTDLR